MNRRRRGDSKFFSRKSFVSRTMGTKARRHVAHQNKNVISPGRIALKFRFVDFFSLDDDRWRRGKRERKEKRKFWSGRILASLPKDSSEKRKTRARGYVGFLRLYRKEIWEMVFAQVDVSDQRKHDAFARYLRFESFIRKSWGREGMGDALVASVRRSRRSIFRRSKNSLAISLWPRGNSKLPRFRSLSRPIVAQDPVGGDETFREASRFTVDS